jgi:hypothetical protein
MYPILHKIVKKRKGLTLRKEMAIKLWEGGNQAEAALSLQRFMEVIRPGIQRKSSQVSITKTFSKA